MWLVITRDCILAWGRSREQAEPFLTSSRDGWGDEQVSHEEEPRALVQLTAPDERAMRWLLDMMPYIKLAERILG